MNPDVEMQTFLQDGYERYAKAKDAVTTFEKEIQERLMLLLEKKEWSNFHAQRGERGRRKAVRAGLSGDVGQPAIWAYISDENGNGIELGIEWGTFDSGRPILYTQLEPGSRKLHLSDPKPPVQNYDGYLFVTVGDAFELEPMATPLLAETDRALARVKPVK